MTVADHDRSASGTSTRLRVPGPPSGGDPATGRVRPREPPVASFGLIRAAAKDRLLVAPGAVRSGKVLLVKTAAGTVRRRNDREATRTVERELLTVWVPYNAGASGAGPPVSGTG